MEKEDSIKRKRESIAVRCITFSAPLVLVRCPVVIVIRGALSCSRYYSDLMSHYSTGDGIRDTSSGGWFPLLVMILGYTHFHEKFLDSIR